MEKELSIKQVAAETGLGVHTLRYYERIGLISSVGRANNGHRRYSKDDLLWIAFLKRMRATGMSISGMQEYAALYRQGDTTLPERLDFLKKHRLEVKQRIAELMENLAVIEHKIELYSRGQTPTIERKIDEKVLMTTSVG